MSLFHHMKTLGTVRMDFASMNEVAVADTIPEGTEQEPYPLIFAFMFAARTLADVPGHEGGEQVLRDGIDHLAASVDRERPLARNESLLGTFSEEGVHFLDHSSPTLGQWVCEGSLQEDKEGMLDVDARIVHAFGDYLHRACIDTVLELTRRRMGDAGGAVAVSALEYFEELAANGCADGDENCKAARRAAVRAAELMRRVPS